MKPIGGFFELELPDGGETYHKGALPLSTARGCLKVALRHLSPCKVYVPYYTCDALLEPLLDLQIPYEFYPLKEDLCPLFPSLGENEYAIYVNYFGLCSRNVHSLLAGYHRKIIVDNSQAFFEQAYSDTWSFNSARKFFGVPDGGYLYAPHEITEHFERNTEFHFAHLINRFSGKQEQSYSEFRAYEESLTAEVRGISRLSERLLSLIDYSKAAESRKANFTYYRQRFDSINQLDVVWDGDSIPFTYPLLLDRPVQKQQLFDKGIFVPTFWRDVLLRGAQEFEFEIQLARQLLPLPVDHRYNTSDCERVSDTVQDLIGRG